MNSWHNRCKKINKDPWAVKMVLMSRSVVSSPPKKYLKQDFKCVPVGCVMSSLFRFSIFIAELAYCASSVLNRLENGHILFMKYFYWFEGGF